MNDKKKKEDGKNITHMKQARYETLYIDCIQPISKVNLTKYIYRTVS